MPRESGEELSLKFKPAATMREIRRGIENTARWNELTTRIGTHYRIGKPFVHAFYLKKIRKKNESCFVIKNIYVEMGSAKCLPDAGKI